MMRGVVEWTGAIIAIVLTGAFAIGYLIGLVRVLEGAAVIDSQMLKEVLLFVLGSVLGAAAMKKGMEQGTFAAQSPSPPAGSTTSTVTTMPPEKGEAKP